ncbi:MAG: PQQ-binding-like beta-propeller repeat protein, partial [Limisphaerales bacterium]
MKSILTLSALLSAFALQAGDWPEFRGPTGQGHAFAKNLPAKWGKSENVVWRARVDGEGWSSPILVDGKLILTSAVSVDGGLSLRTVAFGEKDGKQLWSTELFTARNNKKHKKNSHASATPIAKDGRVYVHFGPNGTACLDLKGKVLWKQNSFDYPPVHGNGGSPIVVDDKLIFSCDGSKNPFVVALSTKTGKVIWKRSRRSGASRKFSFCTPLLIEVKGKRQVITPGSGVVYALNPDDGAIIWECDYDQGYSVVPRPVYAHGLVYVGTGFNQAKLLAIDPTGKGDVTDSHIRWRSSRGISKTPSFIVVGNEIYVIADNGIATCLDAKTGQENWNERIGGGYSASPTYADGKIYVHSESGKTVVIKPGKTYKVLGESELGEKTFASLAVSDNSIYQRSDS